MKKIIILSVALILVGAGCNISDKKQEVGDILIEKTPENIEMPEDIKEELSFLDSLQKNLKTQVVDLKPVDGSDSFGTAYRLIGENKNLQHVVVANLPDLPVGVSYEGWLVQPKPLKFFSTGVMEKNKNGMWILEYEEVGDYLTYSNVVITKETKVDSIPEKHIIEASF